MVKRGVILVSDKISFNPKMVTRDNDGHYTMTRGPIYQEDIIIISIYAPNFRAPKHTKQKLTENKNQSKNQ